MSRQKRRWILPVLLIGLVAALSCGSETQLPGQTVIETVLVERQVPGQTVIETVVIKERVNVPGQTIIQTVVVEKQVPGQTVIETVVVEKEVAGPQVIVTATAAAVAMTADGSIRGEFTGKFIVAEKLIPPPVLVPALAGGGLDFLVYSFGVVDYPLSIDKNDFVDKDLSIWIDWTLAPDLSKISWTMRPGVEFHDGWGEMTAEDIVWSYNNAIRLGSRFYGLNNIMWLDRMEATGTYTGEMYFKEFNPKWIEMMSNISTHQPWIASKALFEDKGERGGADTMIGSGPYSVTSWVANERVVVVATGEHYRVQPKTRVMEVVAIPESLALQAAFLTGEVDIAPIPNNLIKNTFAKLPGSTIERIGEVDTQLIHFTGNYWKKDGPLAHRTDENAQFPRPAYAEALANPDKYPWIGNIDDPTSMERAKNVRIALSMAVDEDAILANIFDGFGIPISTQKGFKPSHAVWKDAWAKPSFDPEGAKALLAANGFPNGFEFEFFAPTGVGTISHEAGQAVAQYWQDIGLSVTVDAGTYASRRDDRFDGVDNIIRMHHVFTGKIDMLRCDGLGINNVYEGHELHQDILDICLRNGPEPDKAKRIANNALVQDYISEWRLYLPISAKANNYMIGPNIADWRPHTNTQPFFIAPWTVVVK